MLKQLLLQRPMPGGMHRYTLSLLALISITYVFGSIWLFECRYGVNDNGAVLEYIQRGLPIAFTGILLTKLLHLGYTLVPEMPWFGLWFYTMHVLSVCAWLWLLSRVFRPWWLAGLFILIFLGYYLPFLLYLDYTDTAMMLCWASLGSVLLMVMEQRPGHLRFLAPGILFMLGELARPQVPLGCLAYAFPLAILVSFCQLSDRPSGVEIRRLALVGLIFFAPAVVNLAVDTAYRHYGEDPQQMQFDAFNALRGKLSTDLTRSRKQMIMQDAPLLASLHWTRVDAVHLFNWNFLDERVDTIPALQALWDKAPAEDIGFENFIGRLRAQAQIDPENLLLLASVLLSLLLVWRRPWLGMIALSAPVYCLVCSSVLSLFLAYSDRTEAPLVLGYGFVSLIICYYTAALGKERADRLSLATALACVLLGCMGAYSILDAEAASRPRITAAITASQEKLDTLNRDYAGQVILMAPNGAMPIFKLSPLKNHPVYFQPIELGWSTFSPLFYQQIGKLGIQHGYELVDALIAHRAYVLGTPEWCHNLLDYVSDPDKRHIDVIEVRRFDDSNVLYQLEETRSQK